jgi:hypothetical protein
VGKPERKRPLASSRPRWQDNIKINLVETGCDGMVWIRFEQDKDQWMAIVSREINLRFP